MACCVIAAFVINRIILACEALNLGLDIQYNDAFENSVIFHGDDGASHNGGTSPFTTKLSLTGMTCSACTATVGEVLRACKGVDEVKVSLQLQRALVMHSTDVKAERLKDIVRAAGYGAEIGTRSTTETLAVLQRKEELSMLRAAFAKSTMFLCIIVSISLFAPPSSLAMSWQSWLSVLILLSLNVVVQVYAASHIHRNAWRGSTCGRLNMDSMISLSCLMGFGLSIMGLAISGSQAETYFQTTAALITVVLGGRYLDAMSRKQSGESLIHLLSSRAEKAMVGSGSGKRRVAASFLTIGDEITVTPYSIIPCDCYVLDGISDVDESIISGESTLQPKAAGSSLLSGSRNGTSVLIARVIKEQEQSTLATMIRDISESTESKMSSQNLTNTIIQWFTLGVIALAVTRSVVVFTFLDSIIPLSARINIVGKSMMTILTAACPCAIGLSVPSAIMSAVDEAWRRGILIVGGGGVLERLSEVTCVVMDKTGTLTRGTHSVQGQDLSPTWTSTSGFSKFCLLICATEEPGKVVHPIGRAIFQHYFSNLPAARHFREHCTITSRREIAGQGMDCSIRMRDSSTLHILVGNELLLSSHNVLVPSSYVVDDFTVAVHIAIDCTYVGRIFLHDTIRSDVPLTLRTLRSRLSPSGPNKGQPLHLTMLTGDSESEALRVSRKLSLPILASRSTPSQKLELINSLTAQGHKVAMVGDGINDALSLSAAHVGIMMTTDSQQCSTIGGHVLVLSPHFSVLSDIFDISDETTRRIQRNFIWAASYNVVALALAMGLGEGLGISISPPVAAGLMSLSSIGVVMNSLARKGPVEAEEKGGASVGKGM